MKLATFEAGGKQRIGVVDTQKKEILDLATASGGNPAFADMLALIHAGAGGLAEAKRLAGEWKKDAAVALDGAKLLAPIPVPPQMRDASVYATHVKNAPRGMQRYLARKAQGEEAAAKIQAEPDVPPVYRQLPVYYITNRFSVIGPDTTVQWPRYSELMDFELEFGVYISKPAKNVSAADAKDYIFGYTIFNDFSARDQQVIEMQGRLGPTKGKSFDMGNAMGPWIVTPDELGNPEAMNVEVRVNGEVWAKNTTADMLHNFDKMIEHISKDETLHPGEFIGSGTVGNCCGLEQDRFLKDGDTIELYVDKIGTLRNKVVRQK
ncbi:MAG TPA: fumarylacetoacetate hydrolase family protein [Xanthobacteraceae bacterium]|nr:fumarylacetoacetate hydrolase family protein [Xanthobacteraceae bacterium]